MASGQMVSAIIIAKIADAQAEKPAYQPDLLNIAQI